VLSPVVCCSKDYAEERGDSDPYDEKLRAWTMRAIRIWKMRKTRTVQMESNVETTTILT